MTTVPQDGDGVLLLNGQSGAVRQIISYWGNLRCWDALVEDSTVKQTVRFYGHNEYTRNAQIREKKNDATNQWREVKL